MANAFGRGMKPQKSFISPRHSSGQNIYYGETYPSYSKAGHIGQKLNQRFNVGSDASYALDVLSESNCSDSYYSQHSYSPFNYSFFNGNASYPPFSQQQSNFNGSNVLSNDSSKYEDVENDKTANILTALVNKILEDTDGDNTYDNASQFSEHMWNTGKESIGELAIQLADLNLLENDMKMEPVKSIQQVSTLHNGGKFYEKPGAMNEKQVYKRKTDMTIKDMKKKKFIPSNWYQNNLKEQPKRTTALNGYGMKPGQKQVRSIPPTPFAPQAPGQKFKNTSMKYSGPPSWMHFRSNDSKSDGSSSSNSSVYKDHTSHTSSDSFNYKKVSKSDSGSGPFPSKQPRRFRKTYSTASSSSGGRISECVFCKTNGETSAIYRGHVLKDDQGRTACSVLQQYVCPLCGATGYNAHTVKYCPKNENPPPIATMTTLKSMRSSTGRKRHGPCSGLIRPFSFGLNRSLLPA